MEVAVRIVVSEAVINSKDFMAFEHVIDYFLLVILVPGGVSPVENRDYRLISTF